MNEQFKLENMLIETNNEIYVRYYTKDRSDSRKIANNAW